MNALKALLMTILIFAVVGCFIFFCLLHQELMWVVLLILAFVGVFVSSYLFIVLR